MLPGGSGNGSRIFAQFGGQGTPQVSARQPGQLQRVDMRLPVGFL